jgi:hypothetical protein
MMASTGWRTSSSAGDDENFRFDFRGGQRKMLHRNPMAYKLHPTYQQKNPSRLVKYGEIQPIFLGFLTMGIPGYP